MRDVIRQFIIENFLYGESDNFHDDDSFLEQGMIDSTGIIELVNFVQDIFEIKVEDKELIPQNLDSVNSLISLINRKQNYAA